MPRTRAHSLVICSLAANCRSRHRLRPIPSQCHWSKWPSTSLDIEEICGTNKSVNESPCDGPMLIRGQPAFHVETSFCFPLSVGFYGQWPGLAIFFGAKKIRFPPLPNKPIQSTHNTSSLPSSSSSPLLVWSAPYLFLSFLVTVYPPSSQSRCWLRVSLEL